MAGNVRFNIVVKTEGADILPELEARCRDLSPAFDQIIVEWAKLNEQKFKKAIGHEASGAQINPDVFWEPLAPSTMAAKRREGMKDWIMVATGSLMRALTDPELIFKYTDAEHAIFGVPSDPEDAAKVGYQWARRQALFFGRQDENVIRRVIKDYFEFGADFQEKRMAAGMAAIKLREEIQMLDEEFGAQLDSDSGDVF